MKSQYEFPVFNGGARACLGRKMAEVMALWVLVRLATSDFDIEEAEKRERRSKNSLTLPIEGGLPCSVKLKQPLERVQKAEVA